MNQFVRSFYRRHLCCTLDNFSMENLPNLKKANFVVDLHPFSNNLEFQFCSHIEENIKYLKVLIIINDPKHDNTADYSAKFSIIQSDKSAHFCNESKLDSFVKLESLNASLVTLIDVDKIFSNAETFLRDGSLYIHIMLQVTKHKKLLTPKINPVLKNYENLVNNPQFSDFKIICSDGKTIYAHKCILLTFEDKGSTEVKSLQFFRSLIESQMQESQINEMHVNDIEFDVMLELMRFIYAGKVNNCKKLARDLLIVADKYNIISLKDFCIKVLEKHLNSENVMDLLKVSNLLKIDELKENCMNFIKFYFSTISTRSDFQELPNEILRDIIESMSTNPPALEFKFDLSKLVTIGSEPISLELLQRNPQIFRVVQQKSSLPYYYLAPY